MTSMFMNIEELNQWCAWTKFIQVYNTTGVVISYPVEKTFHDSVDRLKKIIRPGDDLPPEVNQKSIKKCIYRSLTRNERRHKNEQA